MKKAKRIVAIALVIVNLFLIFSISASALSQSATTKATGMTILTYNSNLLLSQKSTVTVKCTKGSAMKVTFTQISNCKVNRSNGVGFSSWSSFTVYGGGSAKFIIKTGALKTGKVTIKVESLCGDAIAYSVTATDYRIIGKVIV